MTSFLMIALGGQKTVRSQAASQDKGSKIGVGSAATEGCGAAEGGRGPTVLLSYRKEVFEKSPLGSFMYFLPLISPVAVSREISPDNQQQVGVISYEGKVTARSFSVTCEFEMLGDGFNRYTFDSLEMIAMCAAALTKGDTLTQVLDYINLEGKGFGSIQIRGSVNGPAQTVTEVELAFNARGRQSPVTIGLYEAKRKNGLFEYKNRSDEIVARVNSLSFKRGENPRMGITVASIGKKGDNGLLSHIKAAIANLFIKPVEVDSLGNETLLKFGYALLNQEPAFTFPKAANLKDVKIAAATPQPGRQPEALEWPRERSRSMSLTRRSFGEFTGTFWFVLGGCGSAVLAAAFPQVGIGLLAVSLAFSLTVLTTACAFGHISGCHLNPAVSLGLWAGERFLGSEPPHYIGAQVAGGIVGAAVLYLIASGKADFSLSGGFAANGYGDHSPGGYSLRAAFVAPSVGLITNPARSGGPSQCHVP